MVYSEAFQEAFDRMERATNSRNCRNLDELRLVAQYYFGYKWYPTNRQLEALKDEARRRGYFQRGGIKKDSFPWFPRRQPQVYTSKTWRRETVTVRGKPQVRQRPKNRSLHQEALVLCRFLLTIIKNRVMVKTSGRIVHDENSGITFMLRSIKTW